MVSIRMDSRGGGSDGSVAKRVARSRTRMSVETAYGDFCSDLTSHSGVYIVYATSYIAFRLVRSSSR